MNNQFGNKIPDAKGFGESKLNEAKSFGEDKLNEAKSFGQGTPFSSKADTGSFDGGAALSGTPGSFSGKAATEGGAASPMGSGGKESAAMSAGSSQEKLSPAASGSDSGTALSTGTGCAPESQSPAGSSPSAASSGANAQRAPDPKKYIVQADDDFGSIAKKFGLPSWKYLYQINKKEVGDNPDLLKAGTELTIPQWDSTSGDELIREKGADPFAYTGGLQYRYPWVPFSLSLKNEFSDPVVEYDENSEIREEYSKPIKLLIIDAKRNVKIADVEAAKKYDEIELLIPDAQSIIISSEEPDTKPGTLKELIKILKGIESEEGFEAARHFAYYLNYEKICDLVKKGGKDNDPNLMPTRFMLLPGMSDSTIKTLIIILTRQRENHLSR
ncbi:MAG: LysM peptidoglycan-binding domain-containing protein [Chitinispirillaceae bacterium]|nr:LysM peptidoglycan-binding domain-containing protein [Chitinispirillaceae bacterium]